MNNALTSLRSLDSAPRCRFCATTLVIAVISLGGCTAVAPWERGTLAKPHMAVDPLPMQSTLRAHVHSSREAASMSGTAEGGGCGCY